MGGGVNLLPYSRQTQEVDKGAKRGILMLASACFGLVVLTCLCSREGAAIHVTRKSVHSVFAIAYEKRHLMRSA